MADKGFAIRCPHCRKWNVWADVHPEKVALDSKEEFKKILGGLKIEGLHGKEGSFSHRKLLRCESPLWLCPSPFEAFVCRSELDAFDFLEDSEAWSFKRDFRLFKADCKSRWEDKEEGQYYGILFNTQSVPRQREIELELLMDSELLSRLIVGMSHEIQAPLTVFAANAFKPKDNEVSVYWMPIEVYSMGQWIVPATFNKFCACCRNIVMQRQIEKFADENYSVNDCPIGFGKDGKCGGKDAACMQAVKDWTHCPAFMEERQEFPCTNSDLQLIRE
ncbi:MAG: hypothetical protein ACYS6W_12355, partial [Planctomycetota bacterium]